MSVRIRLSRVGKKHVPFYRVVSVDKRKKRDGNFLEDLGTFDAIRSLVVRFDEEGYKRRIEQGAIPSDAVKKIYKMFKDGAQKVQNPTKKIAAKESQKADSVETAEQKA